MEMGYKLPQVSGEIAASTEKTLTNLEAAVNFLKKMSIDVEGARRKVTSDVEKLFRN